MVIYLQKLSTLKVKTHLKLNNRSSQKMDWVCRFCPCGLTEKAKIPPERWVFSVSNAPKKVDFRGFGELKGTGCP